MTWRFQNRPQFSSRKCNISLTDLWSELVLAQTTGEGHRAHFTRKFILVRTSCGPTRLHTLVGALSKSKSGFRPHFVHGSRLGPSRARSNPKKNEGFWTLVPAFRPTPTRIAARIAWETDVQCFFCDCMGPYTAVLRCHGEILIGFRGKQRRAYILQNRLNSQEHR